MLLERMANSADISDVTWLTQFPYSEENDEFYSFDQALLLED